MLKKSFEFLTENFKPLLFSFILALVLWLVVTTNREYTDRLEIPLTVSRLAPDLVLASPLPETVLVEVKGRGRALIGLAFYQPSLNLELPELKTSTTINLNEYKQHFRIPRELGLELVNVIEPKTLSLKVDSYAEVRKPVRINSVIRPLPGYILMDIEGETDSVTVRGPRSAVESMKYVETDSLFRRDVKYPFEAELHLKNKQPGIIQYEPGVVKFQFKIEQLVERNIYNVPIQIIGLPADLMAEARPSTVSLGVKGGESIISQLTVNDVTAVFDFMRSYREGQLDYPVQIETPENVSWTRISPARFRLVLKKRE